MCFPNSTLLPLFFCLTGNEIDVYNKNFPLEFWGQGWGGGRFFLFV